MADATSAGALIDCRARVPRRSKVSITPSKPDYPRSCAANFERPAPVTSEEDVLRIVKREWRSSFDDNPIPRPRRETIIAELVDFEIYRCPKTDRKRASELIGLHLFDVKAKNLCFDGYVHTGNSKHYVERVPIEDLSIEGYGSTSNPDITPYLQTSLASRDATSDIWLRLRHPAPRYERFHSPFMWIAVLGKHVIDYMDDQPKSTVGLEKFTKDFYRWLERRFGSNKKFQGWFTAFRRATDFRVAFNAHTEFFYTQALNLPTARHLAGHPIWSQCKCDRMTAIPRQPDLVKDTLATPHVFQSFQQMYFASKLKQVSPSKAVRQLQKKRIASLGFPGNRTTSHTSWHEAKAGASPPHVRVGDVVSIAPDDVDKTRWQTSNNEWLAYVQGNETNANGAQRLILLWLYRPADTHICLAKYPVANELFLSDNCNCKERAVLTTDVIRKHTVDWSPRSLNPSKDYIIRQTYMTNDSAFVTVKDEHKICPCRKPTRDPEWSVGDTVYITKTIDGEKVLEPVVIHEINHTTKEAKVRMLLRLERAGAALARQAKRGRILPNELVLTGKLSTVSLSRIQRACHVRFVPNADILTNRIPSTYNRGGAGDHWFISLGLKTVDDVGHLVVLEKLPRGFHEASEAALTCKKLRGLSLFSGGGGLDRGLEEGGAVEFQTSVDYDSAAIHTQRANCKDPQRMRLFCGSVDDYLKSLLIGDRNSLVARIGEVDLIAAGSPCPGFSTLQLNMLSEQSLTYASHITTFCTAVDVYRPMYGVLENVVNMASTRTGVEYQNVLSQLVACLVSMGYQVNQNIMDSWTYGSCQRRSRIILTIAAPGKEPLLPRPHTHSRSYEDTSARSLGRLPNGERFGDREHYATPFSYVSAEKATSDLPDIGNGNVQACIPFPDHRLCRPTNSKTRALVECIPRCPSGYGYAKAMQLDLVPPLLQIAKKEVGNSYRRLKADGLVPTITTDIHMQDARNGASVHWSQHRPLSIHEAKRTQGYHDHEPIIGTLSEQWKILGNGVDRMVSFTVGLALRDALLKSGRVPLLNEGLEDETETLVNVEEETGDDLREADEHPGVDILPARPASSSSSSTDSLISMQDVQQTTSTSVDEVQDVKFSPKSATPGEQCGVEKPLSSNDDFLSHLSRQVTGSLGNLSVPVMPPFSHTVNAGFPVKRWREEDGDEQQSVSMTDTGLVKRLKMMEARRTASPVVQTTGSEVKLVIRRASLPAPERTTHTRSSGPAQFAPKTWHKEIGAPHNVINLE